jgi:hypothetical protein
LGRERIGSSGIKALEWQKARKAHTCCSGACPTCMVNGMMRDIKAYSCCPARFNAYPGGRMIGGKQQKVASAQQIVAVL